MRFIQSGRSEGECPPTRFSGLKLAMYSAGEPHMSVTRIRAEASAAAVYAPSTSDVSRALKPCRRHPAHMKPKTTGAKTADGTRASAMHATATPATMALRGSPPRRNDATATRATASKRYEPLSQL